MREKIKKVEEFHKVFGIGIGDDYNSKLLEKTVVLRHRLMEEENDEYLSAALAGDTIETADALGDMLYVLLGTIIEHGMQDVISEVFNEIHNSNMSKLDDDGKVIYREDGKALKGKNYFTPSLGRILKKM